MAATQIFRLQLGKYILLIYDTKSEEEGYLYKWVESVKLGSKRKIKNLKTFFPGLVISAMLLFMAGAIQESDMMAVKESLAQGVTIMTGSYMSVHALRKYVPCVKESR